MPRLIPAVLLLGGALVLAGCVSSKYKRAPKSTPPPVAINVAIVQPPIAAVLHTVIVYQGPGSWKREALWDEYVLSVSNQGSAPLVVESAMLTDALGAGHDSGDNPWELEKLSRENLKKYEHYGRTILVGAGLTVGWVTSAGAAYAAALAGDAVVATAATAVFLALPVWAVASGVRYFVARSSIADEFNRRRIALPLVLKSGETKQGSLFFPVSPGPQRLVLNCRINGGVQPVTLDLTSLADLHFSKPSGAATPAGTGKR